MKFLVIKNRSSESPFKISFQKSQSKVDNSIYINDKQNVLEYKKDNKRIIVLGDLVYFNDSKLSFDFLYTAVKSNKVHEFGGFFYLIYIDDNKLQLYSSLFNILPVYFYENENEILVSSKLELIVAQFSRKPKINRKYLLERVLFNYGLFNDTYFEGIKLLKANHYLNIITNLQEVTQFSINDLYTSNYIKGTRVLNNLSDYFIELTKYFLPNEKYALSFTGGFDGRTLLAISKYYNHDFIAYAFGSEESNDLKLPRRQSRNLGVTFESILLNEKYVQNFSYDAGRKLIDLTDGLASFARAHYLFAAESLSQNVNYMITGNFGSELFRAMHNPGVMISYELIEVFKNYNKDTWVNVLKNSSKLCFIQNSNFEKELDEIIDEIDQFKNSYKKLDLNQFFYIHVLAEIFRKYFGPEIVMQSNFLSNRSPFLNFNFIKELLKSYYCGVYSDFFTDNPIKRFKGQVLYAHIIKNAYPKLLTYYTDKGYKPASLLSNFGKLELLYNFGKKKLSQSKNKKSDFYAVRNAFNNNKEKWLSNPILEDYYDKDYIKKSISSYRDQNLIYNILSSNYYLNQL